MFAILPLFLGSLSELFPEITPSPALRLILLLVGTTILLLKSGSRAMPKSIIFPLFLFAVFGLISVIWSFDTYISLQRAILNAAVILCLYIYAIKVPIEKQLSVIIWSCALTFAVVSMASIPAYLLNDPVAYEQGNFRGYFSNANSLGHYISSAAFSLSIYLFFKTKNWKKTIALFMLIVLTYILIETRSRGAFISAFLAGSVIYFGVSKFKITNVSIFIFPVLALISLIYFSEFAFEKYENISTFSTRSYLWDLHVNAIAERPLGGWGVGINPVDFKMNVNSSYNYLSDTEKGSSYYVLFEEIGIPLSVLILAFFGKFFLRDLPGAFKALRRDEEMQLGLIPISIVISGLFHGIFESWFFSFGNPMTIIFWISCIFIASYYQDEFFIVKDKLRLTQKDRYLRDFSGEKK